MAPSGQTSYLCDAVSKQRRNAFVMAAWRLLFPLLLLLSELWSKTETDNVTLKVENSTDETSPTGTSPSETSLPGTSPSRTSPSGTSPSRTPGMQTEKSAGELGGSLVYVPKACSPLSFEANYPPYRLFLFWFFLHCFKNLCSCCFWLPPMFSQAASVTCIQASATSTAVVIHTVVQNATLVSLGVPSLSAFQAVPGEYGDFI